MKINELKILLALVGYRRIPHLEEEIFASKRLARLYITLLISTSDKTWLSESYYISTGILLHRYALHVLKQPWPAAEHVIVTDRNAAFYYAIYVLQRRWIEAEPIISTYRRYWQEYKDKFEITD